MKTIIPFLIIALCAGMYFVYISPMWDEVNGLRVEKAEHLAILQKIEDLKVKRDKALQDFNSIPESDLERLNKIIPSSFDSVTFLNDLNVIASKNGLSLKEFKSNQTKAAIHESPDTVTAGELYKTVSFNFTVTGNYDQFLNFLRDVEIDLQLVDVTNLSIKPSVDEKTGAISMKYSLEASTYSLK